MLWRAVPIAERFPRLEEISGEYQKRSLIFTYTVLNPESILNHFLCSRSRCTIFGIGFLIMIIVAIGVTAGTAAKAKDGNAGLYVLYVGKSNHWIRDRNCKVSQSNLSKMH